MIGTVLAKVGGFFSGLLGTLVKYAGIVLAYFAARNRVKAEIAKEASEVKDEQLEIAARPDAHRGTLLERMFKRKRH